MANILVADDDDLLGELVRFKLEAAGHQRLDGAKEHRRHQFTGTLWALATRTIMLLRIVASRT